jgi:hypothetical protein
MREINKKFNHLLKFIKTKNSRKLDAKKCLIHFQIFFIQIFELHS